MTQLAQCEDALQFEQPKVFTEWANATEAHRAIMQVRLLPKLNFNAELRLTPRSLSRANSA